jgi:hypothetical protein
MYILGPDEASKQRMPFFYAAMVIMSTDLAEKQPRRLRQVNLETENT